VCENDAESRISRSFAYGVLAQVLCPLYRLLHLSARFQSAQFDAALNLFQWNLVATILLAIFVVVILAEIVVTFVRRRIL